MHSVYYAGVAPHARKGSGSEKGTPGSFASTRAAGGRRSRRRFGTLRGWSSKVWNPPARVDRHACDPSWQKEITDAGFRTHVHAAVCAVPMAMPSGYGSIRRRAR